MVTLLLRKVQTPANNRDEDKPSELVSAQTTKHFPHRLKVVTCVCLQNGEEISIFGIRVKSRRIFEITA